jgi:hypothetical protein
MAGEQRRSTTTSAGRVKMFCGLAERNLIHYYSMAPLLRTSSQRRHHRRIFQDGATGEHQRLLRSQRAPTLRTGNGCCSLNDGAACVLNAVSL